MTKELRVWAGKHKLAAKELLAIAKKQEEEVLNLFVKDFEFSQGYDYNKGKLKGKLMILRSVRQAIEKEGKQEGFNGKTKKT